MASFAQFASDLDPSTQRLLARGERLTELLKQGQYSPLSMEEQVVSIYAGTRGYLDGIKVSDVTRFEHDMLSEIRSSAPDILEGIRVEKALSEDIDQKLKAFLEKFAKTFA